MSYSERTFNDSIITWQGQGEAYSQPFGDVYFSTQNGFAESCHVFIEGNEIPNKILKNKQIVIAETGFGTGLNLFAMMRLLRESGSSCTLKYQSLEKYPLKKDAYLPILSLWPELKTDVEAFCDQIPEEWSEGTYDMHLTDQVTLSLYIGDARDILPIWETPIDAWFLDGFAPKKNPEMWDASLYDAMKRLTVNGGSAATFTVAGHVRRAIEAVGFTVEKAPGFGTKKQMLKAVKHG